MSGPDILRIKRKRTEPAPDALLIERPGKRQNTDYHYVLKGKGDELHLSSAKDALQSRGSHSTQHDSARTACSDAGRSNTGGAKQKDHERRTFHLKRPSSPRRGIRRRKGGDDAVATFIEEQSIPGTPGLPRATQKDGMQRQQSPGELNAEPLKRPSRNAAVKIIDVDTEMGATVPTKSGPNSELMAEYLHQFALEESAKEGAEKLSAKPKITARPKLPPHRSRELHQLRVSRNKPAAPSHDLTESMDLDEESEYVYDTYVIASSSSIGAAQVGSADALGNVGYLVITEEDQAIWETYLEDEPSDKDWNSDEEDENAEDWYGADYPDDELASDDEFNRNAYNYRAQGGSDDEEWNADTGNFSNDELDDDLRPWHGETKQIIHQYFGQTR